MTPLGLSTANSSNFGMRNSIPEEDPDRLHPEETTHHRLTSMSMSRNLEYQTTPDGDILVVQPSFDDPGRKTPPETSGCQARSPPPGEKQCDLEVRNPASPPKASAMHRGHSRQLSAHFFDATSLKEKDEEEEDTGFGRGGGSGSDGEGRKHRRIFSGDLTNPSQLHRRLDSRGQRGSIRRDGRFHHREDSAGLDILSAAADATKDELADAVGMPRSSPMLSPWEPPSHHQTESHSSMGQVPAESYDTGYVHAMPPPPSNPSRQGHNSMNSYTSYVPPSQVPAYPPSHYPYPPPPHYYGPPSGSLPQHPGSVHHHPSSLPLQRPSDMHAVYSSENALPHRRSPVDSWDHAPLQHLHQQHHHHHHHQPLPPPEGEGRSKQPNHQGSQTFVTAIAVGSGTKTLQPTVSTKNASTNTSAQQLDAATVPSQIRHHHRKLSSFSSLGTLLGSGLFSPNEGAGPEPRSGGAHHRKTSSTLSFLQGLDVGLDNADDQFLKNLQAAAAAAGVDYRVPTPQHMRFATSSVTAPAPPSSASITTATTTTRAPPSVVVAQPVGSSAALLAAAAAAKAPAAAVSQQQLRRPSMDEDDESWDDQGSKLAAGGTSKRLRRKCTMGGCQNRVVQGGLCISHGARRKTCKHPGCNKNVKKAGLCSTHGPARKRCDFEGGCSKVAVQGGRCIAHGAKKKLCLVGGCTKQAILSGMCKKHHDQANIRGISSMGGNVIGLPFPREAQYCQEIKAVSSQSHKPSHTRGLSIFQEISPDAVNELLNDEVPNDANNAQADRRAGGLW